MRVGFRGKAFVAVAVVAVTVVLLTALLVSIPVERQVNAAIERTLTAEARLAAQMLSQRQGTDEAALRDETNAIARTISARVTLVAADGGVVGDSAAARDAPRTLETDADRPEVIAARRDGLAVARRFSPTPGRDTLYVAASVRHPLVSVVRLAVPLADPAEQLGAVRQVTLVAVAVALASALAVAVVGSTLLGRRVHAIAASARAYAAGDLNHPARGHHGDELGTVAKVLDDTVRDLARRMAELERDRAGLAAILSGMHEGVLVVDGGGRVQMVNRAATSMLRLEADAVDRHYIESIRHPGIAGVLAAALAGIVPDLVEFQPARSPLRLVARAAPVGTGTSATGAVLVLHDVTELRRADLMRTDFVANVSHELRTPLTAIRGYVEALTDEPLDPAERQQFLEVIARQTTRMERLIRDLLRLASLDAREEPIDVSACVLDDLLRGVVRDLTPSVERKMQHVSVSVAPEVTTITIDAAKLQDALRNIVENASNYSPEGSRITVSAERAGDHMVIRVEDEGPGLPAADLERIFERFYRVDKARSRESGGTGLGLSIVKHLIARLSGDVAAANRPEGGAVFTITLPFTPTDRRAETRI